MLKRELIQRVADMNPHLRASDAEKIVNTIFEEMMAAMARGDRVELRGIGIFTVPRTSEWRLAGSRHLFKEQLIYEQSATRTVREQQENRTCVWSRQPLKIEQLHCDGFG